MSFFYDDQTGDIRHVDDGSVMAGLAETVSAEDGCKMAAGPELFDALAAILYAWEIGELRLPFPLSEAARAARDKATYA